MYRLLRDTDLCKGGDAQQRSCPLALTAHCESCGSTWDAPETGPSDSKLSAYTGDCPSCASSSIRLLRCDSCPVAAVERHRRTTQAGRLLERVLELDFDTEHFAVPWDAVTCEDNAALKVLAQERRRRDKELQVRAQAEAEQDRMMREARRGR